MLIKKLIIFVFILSNTIFGKSMYYEYDYPMKKGKPYIEWDFSENLRPQAPAPYENRSKSPGVAINFGFRF